MSKEDEDTFHGGFVRNRGEGRGVRVARAKVREMPFPDPTTVQETSKDIDGTRQFPNIKTPHKTRRTQLACLGISVGILDAGSPEYARCVRLANKYRKQRVKELYVAHGYVSSGVAALLASAALAVAASRFIYETSSTNARDHLSNLKLASSLSDSARQNELSAWELCAREAVVKKRNDINNVVMPWIQSELPEDLKKRGPGRPRKVSLLPEVNTSAGT